MNGMEQSLLSHLDAPIVVGDPEGNSVYANPAFESRFGIHTMGIPLAELFQGGAREAVLRGLMNAIETGSSARFRVREGDVGFSAVASPIKASGERVGVVILFKEEVEGAERLFAIQRELQGPMGEISSALDTLYEETGGRRNPIHRTLVEDAQRAHLRVQKWCDEFGAILSGGPDPANAVFDPIPALREVIRRAGRISDAKGISLELLLPSALSEVHGDEGRFAEVLLRLVEARLEDENAAERMTLSARIAGRTDERMLLVSISEHGGPKMPAAFSDEPIMLEALASIGAELRDSSLPGVGRSTLVHFSA